MKRYALSLCILAAVMLAVPAARTEEIVAVTQLASGREMMKLYGVKKLCVGVHPLPAKLKSKAITEESLVEIMSERVSALDVNIDHKTATHLLSLQLIEDGENTYDLLLTVTSVAGPIWSLKMRASLSGHHPQHINELVKRGTLIFCRNYQIANSNIGKERAYPDSTLPGKKRQFKNQLRTDGIPLDETQFERIKRH